MRCPQCQHNQKTREGMSCNKCGYGHVFQPRTDRLSDYAFTQLLQRLSGNGHLCFTREQLAVALCRLRLRGKDWLALTLFLMIFFGLFSLFGTTALSGSLISGSVVAAFISGSVLMLRLRFRNRTSYADALRLIDRYHQRHPIALLATGTAYANAQPPTVDPHYAPERILVVEHDEMVDMLIRNRFHQTARTAVVSASGYPAGLFAACAGFIARHPQIPVQVLHEASALGFNRINQLRNDSRWRFAANNLVDIGLNPAQLHSYHSTLPWLDRKRKTLTLTRQHKKMLAGGATLPLAFAPPQALLGLFAAAVAGSLLLLPDPSTASEIGVEVGGDDFG